MKKRVGCCAVKSGRNLIEQEGMHVHSLLFDADDLIDVTSGG